jgi:hypothetical protein
MSYLLIKVFASIKIVRPCLIIKLSSKFIYHVPLIAFKKHSDKDNKEIGKGYTLYSNIHAGYQLKFFKDKVLFCQH